MVTIGLTWIDNVLYIPYHQEMNNFNKKLTLGQITEGKIANLIKRNTGIQPVRVDDYTCDLSMNIAGRVVRIECKTDQMAWRTGNVAIELIAYGKPSGIATSFANVWAIAVENTVYFVTSNSLKKAIKSCKIKTGGDKVDGVPQGVFALLPLTKLKEISVKAEL